MQDHELRIAQLETEIADLKSQLAQAKSPRSNRAFRIWPLALLFGSLALTYFGIQIVSQIVTHKFEAIGNELSKTP